MARGNETNQGSAGWGDGAKESAAAKSPEFWQGANKPKAPAKPPMKRWKKVVLFGGGGLLLIVVVLVAAAPSIAGSMAPGIISSAASEQIKGPVNVSNASFSWTGMQKIGPITILDPTKPAGSNVVATVSIEIDRGLMGLASAMGSAPDVGEIKVSGSAKIVRYSDGTTNLDRALEPVHPAPKDKPAGGGGSKEPARLARGTKASVLIDAIDVSYTDETSPQSGAAIKGLKGEATIGPDGAGTSARVKLAGKASGGAAGAEGTIKVDIKAEQIADGDGVVRPEKAKLDATIDVGQLPTQLVDSLAGMGGKLVAGLGPTLGVNIGAKGTMKSAQATIKVVSDGATVDGELAMADSVLTTSAPIVAKVTGAAVKGLSDIDASLAKSGSTKLIKAPDVTVTVDKVRVKLPASGAKFDLAGTAASVSLKTTEMGGTIKLQESGAPSEFKVSPIEATLATEDLAGAVKLAASGNATIGGQPAGTLSADVAASNLLGKGGGGGTPSVQGTVKLKGVATPIAQPFVAAAGLDLARDIGPTLDAEVKIATASSGVGAGSVPPVTADLLIASAKLNAKGGFELKDSALRSAGGPFTLSADSVGGLVARFIDPKAGYTVAPGGKLTVAVSDVNVPFKDGDLGKAQLDKAGMKAQLGVQGMSVTPSRAGAAGNLEVSTFALGIVAAPGAAPKIDLNGAMAYASKPFTLAGAMEVPGLYSFKADGTPMVTPVGARPNGTIELKNVPTGVASLFAMAEGEGAGRFAMLENARVSERMEDGSVVVAYGIEEVDGVEAGGTPAPLAQVVGWEARRASGPFAAETLRSEQAEKRLPPPPAQSPAATPASPAKPPAPTPETPSGPSLDMGRFLSDAIGPTVDVKLVSGAAKGAEGVDLGLSVKAERLVAEVQTGLSDKAVDIKRVGVDATVAPSALDTVLATYAPNLTPRPQLAGTSKLTVGVEPVSIPVGRDKDGASRLDLGRAGIATVKVSLPQQTLLQKMVLKNADGTTTDLGQLGVEGLDLVAKVPLALADPKSAGAQRFDVTLSGRALDGPGSAMLKIAGTASGEVASGAVRTADASFKVTDVRVASIDRLAGKPGLVSGAIGDSAAVNLDAKVRPATGGTGTTTDLELALQAPRVKMTEPLRVSKLPDRVRSDRPVQIAWQVEPAWADQVLFAPAPGQAETKEGRPKLKGPVNVTVNISKFAISSGEGRGPLVASIFELGAATALSATELAMPDGSTIKLAGTKVNVQSAPGGAIAGGAGDKAGAQSAGLAFDLKVDEIAVTQPSGNPPPAKSVSLTGTVAGLSDATGNVSSKTATVSANGDLPAIPTALIDMLARQNGLLVDALGPMTSAQIRADHFGASGGTLDLVAKSDRASASVRGSVGEGVFVTSEPIKASLTEITAALAKRFIKGMPLVGTVEKKPTDEPAMITASSMRVPMDNDLRKLDGEVLIDPGVARFTSGETFGKILKAINQKTEANIGQRIDPLSVHIKQGVATYDKWTVPIGQNKLNTQGTVDLVNETLDVITYVPLGALTEDVAGLFKAQAKLKQALGGTGLDENLMVPFRSRGSFGKVKTEPDMELFVKESLKSVKPEDLIKKGIGDLLKPKPKPEGPK